ncbi:hypothetical protein CLOHYLEM_06338 [[Clostridium] hylemonae DSM 15053]|uniref:Uncharacterized protein n=1 Tax=[Clostridium] hylemonae DSM 15053 TaxID=553973 RepID=C0C2N2_9FIRM|nr:hypothetical protein CLOHYLEM_06338 [[Clostridium] hylemonae DSM 15053]
MCQKNFLNKRMDGPAVTGPFLYYLPVVFYRKLLNLEAIYSILYVSIGNFDQVFLLIEC